MGDYLVLVTVKPLTIAGNVCNIVHSAHTLALFINIRVFSEVTNHFGIRAEQ